MTNKELKEKYARRIDIAEKLYQKETVKMNEYIPSSESMDDRLAITLENLNNLFSDLISELDVSKLSSNAMRDLRNIKKLMFDGYNLLFPFVQLHDTSGNRTDTYELALRIKERCPNNEQD